MMSTRKSVFSMTFGVGALLLVSALGAFAQLQSGEQTCVNSLNKDGAAVAKEQGKNNVACVKGKGKGTLIGSTDVCVAADSAGVAKKKAKTVADDTKSCGTAPGFGYAGAGTVNGAAKTAEVNLAHDMFGAVVDTAVISCGSNKPGCGCQQKIQKTVETLSSVKLAEFVKCKKAALKAGATSAAALQDCVSNAGTPGSIAADSKGKIAKTVTTLNAAIVKACDTPGVTAGAFPGNCNGDTGAVLGACLDRQVECRVCQLVNAADALTVDCDLFDNGAADLSCANAVATPTPTPTVTPTPQPTSTALAVGALTSTVGRFNYNLTLGLPGANAACNSNFAGSHACTYQELQGSEINGALVGLTDTGANTVTSFWAIDPNANPLSQCVDDAFGGSGLNWEYGTAHTPSRGNKVPLNNGTGALGSLSTGNQCNISGSAWVGCCK